MSDGKLPDPNLNGRDRYGDIIDLPHWNPNRKHPRMSLHDRAAQFAPFAALVGYDEMVDEEARLTDREIELGDGQRETLDRKLGQLISLISGGTRPEVTVTYFIPDERKAGGKYTTIKAPVRRVDTAARKLILITRDRPDLPETLEIDRIIDIRGKGLRDPEDDF